VGVRERRAGLQPLRSLATVGLGRCDHAVAVFVYVHHHHVDVDVLVLHVLVGQLRPPRLAVRRERRRDLLAQRAVELGRRRGPLWRRTCAPVLLQLAHLPLVLRREVAPLLVAVRCNGTVDGGDPALEELALAQQADGLIGREPHRLGLGRWLLAWSGEGCSGTRLSLDVLEETAAVAAASTEGHGAN